MVLNLVGAPNRGKILHNGLAASALVLGFITALAIWTRRKRAFIGTGIAFLAVLYLDDLVLCLHPRHRQIQE